jgi:hypothetical protein
MIRGRLNLDNYTANSIHAGQNWASAHSWTRFVLRGPPGTQLLLAWGLAVGVPSLRVGRQR